MSTSLKASLTLDLNDRLSGRTRGVNSAITRMSSNTKRAMATMKRAADSAYRGLDRLGNRYTGFITGAGGVAAVRSFANMETRLKRLGIQASQSADEIEKLRKEVTLTSQAADIRLNPTELLDAIDIIVEKTGNLELARSNIRNIGLAIQASGSDGRSIGALVADLNEKFNIKNNTELFETLDLLINQGKAGAFTLQNLAQQGERVTAAYSVTGRVTKGAAREMGAMLQVIRKGTGSSEMAATAFEALMRTLNDATKRQQLGKLGIQLTDPDDPKRMRSVTEIVKDLVRATDGNIVKLSRIFDAEAMRSLNLVAAEFSKTGGFESLDGFMGQTADGATLLKDAFNAADRSAAKWEVVATSLKDAAFNNLKGPITSAANVVGNTEPGTLNKAVGIGMAGVGILGSLALGVKGHKAIKGIFGKKGVAGAAAAGAMAAGVQRVLVVNWPLSLGAAGGQLTSGFGRVGKNVGKSGKLSKLGKLGKLGKLARAGGKLGRVVPYLGLGLTALDVGATALSGKPGAKSEALGSLGGGLAGAAAGAAIGSVVPILGTAIGAAIGGVIGSFGGGALGQSLGTKSENELSGEIHIKVDAEGRTKVNANVGNSGVNTTVDQGVLMGAAL